MGGLMLEHGSLTTGGHVQAGAGRQQHRHHQQQRQQQEPTLLPSPRHRDGHATAPPAAAFVPASPAHADACLAIQHATYPADLWEARAVVASILAHGCSFLALEGGTPVGYLQLHHVAGPASPPPLNHPLPPPPLPALPSSSPSSFPTTAPSALHPASTLGPSAPSLAPNPLGSARHHLFIHDLCLLPSHHGLGLGSRLARHALAHLAPHSASVSCVALPGAVGFWERLGFVSPAATPHTAAQAALSTYPTGSKLLLLAAQRGDGGPA